MSRFLFVVPPLTGHVNPTVAVGEELSRRGHEVAWAGYPGTLRPLLPARFGLYPVVDAEMEALLAGSRQRWLALHGPAALKFLWEEFIVPLGHSMLPGVSAAVAAFRPDVVVDDQQALAGALAARQSGICWATSATTSAELTRPLAATPKVEGWVDEQMASFQLEHGVRNPVDLRFSDRLVIAFTTADLLGTSDTVPAHWALVGPALAPRADEPDFPWHALDGRRRVLISLGTLNGAAGRRFYDAVLDATAGLGAELQVIVVAPAGMIDDPPPHLLVRERVPQLALLPHVAAVVSHGGHNTVCEALAHALPLVVAPIRDDQPVIARQVTLAGAGVRVSFPRVTGAALRDALLAVLGDPAYRAAAGRLRESFAAAGGAATAADRLERLL